MLPASALVSAPLNCRKSKANDAPRQATSFSASISRPTKSALLLVHPPGLAPPATTTLVSASHRPPSLMPHSSRRPSVPPSQPVPVEDLVAAGLPLTAAKFSVALGVRAGGGGDCACAWPANNASVAQQSPTSRAARPVSITWTGL